MKISMKQFVSMLVLFIVFNWVYPAGALYAEEVMELPQGYESMLYFYQFKNSEGYLNPKWKIFEGELPEGLEFNLSGLLHGTPVLNEEEEEGKTFDFKVKVSGKVIEMTNNGPAGMEEKCKNFFVRLKINKYPLWCRGEYQRSVIGLEQSGASCAKVHQKVFLDIYLSTPFPVEGKKFNRRHPKLGRPFNIWGNIKITTLPQQISTSFVKIPEEFFNVVKSMKINEIASGIEYLVGFDWRLWKLRLRGGKKMYSLNIIGAYGITTPNNPVDSFQIFKLPEESSEDPNRDTPIVVDKTRNELIDKYNLDNDYLKGKQYVAFLNPDRKKFFRQWFFGIRIKGYSKPEPVEKLENGSKIIEYFDHEFPGFFEVSLGRNDFIAHNHNDSNTGKKNLLVLRMGGSYSFRIFKKFNVYLFGLAMLHFDKRAGQDNPIILEPAPKNTPFPDPSVAQITFVDDSRDYYRIGVGVELFEIIRGLFK